VNGASDGYNISIFLELFARRGQETSTLQELEEDIEILDGPALPYRHPNHAHLRSFIIPISPPRKLANRERVILKGARPVEPKPLNSPPDRIAESIEPPAASPSSDGSRILSASSDHTATTPSSEEPEDCGCSQCHLDDLRSECSFADPTSKTAQAAFSVIRDQLDRENLASQQQGHPGLQPDQRKELLQDRCEEWVDMRYFEWRMRGFPCVPDSQEDQEHPAREELILDAKRINGRLFYLVRWRGYPDESDTWEPLPHIDDAHLVYKYHRRHPNILAASHCLDGWRSDLSEAL
jgi:hypothetical protein